jgi:hypothetical protein
MFRVVINSFLLRGAEGKARRRSAAKAGICIIGMRFVCARGSALTPLSAEDHIIVGSSYTPSSSFINCMISPSVA